MSRITIHAAGLAGAVAAYIHAGNTAAITPLVFIFASNLRKGIPVSKKLPDKPSVYAGAGLDPQA